IIAMTTMVVLSLAFLIVGWVAHGNARRISRYRSCALQFYGRVAPVVEDDETPDEILDMIAFINARIADPSASRELRRALRDRKSRTAPRAGAEFFKRRQELVVPFSEACAAALLALTYNDGWNGWRTRKRIALMRKHVEF